MLAFSTTTLAGAGGTGRYPEWLPAGSVAPVLALAARGAAVAVFIRRVSRRSTQHITCDTSQLAGIISRGPQLAHPWPASTCSAI